MNEALNKYIPDGQKYHLEITDADGNKTICDSLEDYYDAKFEAAVK